MLSSTSAASPSNASFVEQRIQQIKNMIEKTQAKKRAVPKRLINELARMKSIHQKIVASAPYASKERHALSPLEENMPTPTRRSVKVPLQPLPVPPMMPSTPIEESMAKTSLRRRKTHVSVIPSCEPNYALKIGKNVYQPYHFRIWKDVNGLEHFVYIPFCIVDPHNRHSIDSTDPSFKWYFRIVFMIPDVCGTYHGQLTDDCFSAVHSLWNKIESFQHHAWFAKV